MENTKRIKNINNHIDSQKKAAFVYYSVIAAVYGIHFTPKELDLVVHIALNGSITTPPIRESYIEEYKSNKFSLNNMISVLQRKGILIKDEGHKIRLRPELVLLFDKGEYVFSINLKYNDFTG